MLFSVSALCVRARNHLHYAPFSGATIIKELSRMDRSISIEMGH
jgi:hypothetical protein